MEERKIERGDIYRADLTPVVGSEQGGSRRPVLIISNNIGNKHSPTVIIAAITGLEHAKANLPTHIIVKGFEKFEKDSIILLEQIRTIDKQRLKQYMGMMPNNIMARVDKALAISLALTGK
ncbi:type II toxin-antitoxin system PemK/MazF family toxin [Lachnospiraceae bacterium OttesenSCG-928-J05]|nr:type II toxin-antitoxin system PemK/MazF family toxin [Lachnospiraceae bacterium OttesenSCG-928-J05]MDL2276348.1 type II toxin-antitoxin system PemK/MazF family toxin [Breznakia sp. OttesenSCG-928-G09]